MPGEPGRTHHVATFLRRSGAAIIDRWVETVRETPWARDLDAAAIRHNTPSLIPELAARAEGDEGADARIRHVVRDHAAQRNALGYSLEQLLWENALFRRAILDQLGDEYLRLPRREKTILHESIDEAAEESARFFAARQAQENLRLLREAEEARDRAEEILARITEGFFAIDADYRITYINKVGERLLGRPLHEVRGMRIWDAFPGSRETSVGRAYQEAMATGTTVARVLYYPPWDRWFDVRVYPSPTGLSVYFRDETERIVRDRERERLLEILEHGDAAFVTDASFRIIYVNGTQERLSGVPRERSLGRNLWEAFPAIADPKRRFWREYHRVMEKRVPVQFDEFYEPTGIWVGASVYPTREGGIAGFFRDITDRKNVELAQERLVGVVGHDLRNPLTAVRLGIHRVASREDVPLPLRTTLHRTLRSIDKMDRMITDLLDYSRVQAGGGIALEKRPADMGTLLQALADEFAESHPGRVLLRVAADLEGNWDPDRLEQVFSNLISNALRHGDPARPVTITATARDGKVQVEVHNEGPPIPPEMRSRIFQPFESGSGGLGLGLYISCNIVAGHGGTIAVASREGHGTTFTVTLPRG